MATPQLPDAGQNNAIIIENGDNPLKVSLQTVQGIYNEITGKTEQIGRGFEVSFQIEFADIEQLHLKMMQLCEQYNICSSNHSVTIYYSEDNKEQFSSFERFRLYNKNNPNPVESLVIKYNFLIILPQVNKPQSYTVTVKLASRVAIIKKLQQDVPTSVSVFRVMGSRTALITVDYVDYLVARNFVDTFDVWTKTLTKSDLPVWLLGIQRHSHHMPSILRYAIMIVLTVIIAKRIPAWIPPASTDLGNLGLVLFLVLTTTIFCAELGKSIGRFLERSLDDLSGISYLKLTRGDELLVSEAAAENRWIKIKVAIGILGSFLLGVLSSIVANKI
jgi:hypothetical protein